MSLLISSVWRAKIANVWQEKAVFVVGKATAKAGTVNYNFLNQLMYIMVDSILHFISEYMHEYLSINIL